MPAWSAYNEIAAVLLVAAVIGALGLKLRQPLIISFLVAGILVGPSGLRLVRSHSEIALLAEIGISLLLFVVGLRLDVGMVRTVGPVALATGLGQVVFTSVIGFGLSLAFGMSWVTSAYVSVALTFSSTIIIVKLLSDKKEIDALHGRIAVGFLLVQDIVAILALIGLTAFGGGPGEGRSFLRESLWIGLRGLALLGCVGVLMRWVLPRILAYLSRLPELLVLFAVTWAVALAAAAGLLGFSKEVGAFLAGVSLASTPQRDAIGARLVVLRDFLLLFFFIDLGARLEVSALGAELGTAAVFSAFVLLGNPLIVIAIMGLMGYRRRTGFMCGLTVAQISEFSLILGALGVSLGHIGGQAMNLITLVGLVTILASTYMILYSGPLYERLRGVLGLFERQRPFREAAEDTAASQAARGDLVIVLGLGNYGSAIAAHLRHRGRHILAVDFDPEALRRGREQGCNVLYGDVGDPEILAQLPLSQARWLLCTPRDPALNVSVMNLLRTTEFAGRFAVAVASEADAERVRAAGAHVALEPFRDAAEQAADILTAALHSLPTLPDWPAVLEEVPLRSGSAFAGKTIQQIALPRETGASILAVSRAGNVHLNPGPNLQVFPGDRLVLLGEVDAVSRAVKHLDLREAALVSPEATAFSVAEIPVSPDRPCVGKTLAELRFRQVYEATIIGIRRGDIRITLPGPQERIAADDRLILLGAREAMDRLKQAAPL